MTQAALFELPPCPRCHGDRTIRNRETGGRDVCPDCNGAGTLTAACRVCGAPATGGYCGDHDPETARIPY